MKQQKIILLLVMVAVVMTMILYSNIGYASVAECKHDDIISSPDKSMFNVEFYGKPTIYGEGNAQVRFVGNRTAIMNISGLKKVGDSVTARFKMINRSSEFDAELSKSVTNSNREYFKVTVILSDNEIEEKGGQETVSVKVELIKARVNTVEKANIHVKIIATPDD